MKPVIEFYLKGEKIRRRYKEGYMDIIEEELENRGIPTRNATIQLQYYPILICPILDILNLPSLRKIIVRDDIKK